jgi:hypothetical protein
VKLRSESGVALILTLMVTGVIAIVILQFALSARQDVNLAQRLLDRAEAGFLLRSRRATLMFELATRPWTLAESGQSESLTTRWNFHGQPFEHAGVVIEVQDVNGLYPLTRLVERDVRFERLISGAGFSLGEARVAAENVAEFWRLESILPFLQTFDSLKTLTGLDVTRLQQLDRLITVYPTTFFNPLTAPREVLSLYFEDFAVESILAARLPKALNSRPLDYTYSGERDIVYYPGPALVVRLRANVRGVEVREEGIWVIKPFSDDPIRYWGPGS